MAPPLSIGLTGPIASGKTTALEIFERLGGATISADAVVHRLLDDEPMLSRMRDRWGERVTTGGRADRAAIGRLVFNDPDELAWLEAEIHPLVRERMASWAAEVGAEARFTVAEVPLLFEGGMESAFDITIAVVADDQLRRERAAARGEGLTAERESQQLSGPEKAARADHVIVNDGSREQLEAAIAGLLESLLQP